MMFERNVGRRGFLQGAAAAAMAAGLGGRIALAADPCGKPEAGKIGDYKISLAQWSLHRALRDPNSGITNLDFPEVAREKYGIEAVEFVNQFFMDKARDDAYLKQLKKRADDHGVRCVLIMCDGAPDMSSPEAATREKAVEFHRAWVDAAAALGCGAIRINTGEHYSPTDVGAISESCRKLSEYGDTKKINVICENHGGPSSNPDAMVALMKAVDHPRFGTLPDFGNFPKKDGKYALDVYEAIARMMPYAKGVSAKSYDFDADGREKTLDYARILKIVTDAGYHGYVGIEYEGGGPEPEGILATKKLLESLRGAEYKPTA